VAEATSVSVKDGTAPVRVHTEQRITALDGIRGIAIVLVLLFHFPQFAWMRPISGLGWCGVDLFFVLSGYLITGILYSTKNKPHYFRNFYVRRSLRIFPLYYGFLLLVIVALPNFVDGKWLGLETLPGRKAEFFLYYANFAVIFKGWPPHALGAFWSLAVEEHFYLFWPLLVRFSPNEKLLRRCGAVVVLAICGRLALAFFKAPWTAEYYLTTSRMDSLALGGFTAILLRQHPGWPGRRGVIGLAGGAVAILAGVALWRGSLGFDDWPMRTLGYTVLAVLFACLVGYVGTTDGRLGRFVSNPILVSFGRYSYGIYIFHVLVLTICERSLGPWLFPKLGLPVESPLRLFVLSMGLVFTIAYLSWHFYEKHFLALKERFVSI
jgi:peptidoglycan/LPS O-acetylase OafA/YrhL